MFDELYFWSAGVGNLAPFSYFNVISHDPPCVVISVCTSGARKGGYKDTAQNILDTGYEYESEKLAWVYCDGDIYSAWILISGFHIWIILSHSLNESCVKKWSSKQLLRVRITFKLATEEHFMKIILCGFREFCVNIISEWFVEAANHTCGNYDPDVNEMDLSGLTPEPSIKVMTFTSSSGHLYQTKLQDYYLLFPCMGQFALWLLYELLRIC